MEGWAVCNQGNRDPNGETFGYVFDCNFLHNGKKSCKWRGGLYA